VAFDDFGALFRSCGKDLVRFLTRRVACPEMAADIAQEAFARMISGSKERVVRDPRSYLFRAAANLASNQRRRGRVLPLAGDPHAALASVADSRPGADRVLMDRESLSKLEQAIETLPERQREVFLLNRVEGLDPAAVAARLGISRNMVDKHLRQALVRCLQYLDTSD
jgi:RNA polymerase sigma-70 factor (ECF subfamily)